MARKQTCQGSDGAKGKQVALKSAPVLCCHCKVPVIISVAASLQTNELSHTGKPCCSRVVASTWCMAVLSAGSASPGVHHGGQSHLGGFEFPGQPCHHVHSVSTTHAHGAHAQPTSIGRVGVCANHHASREGIVLKHNLRVQRGLQLNHMTGSMQFAAPSAQRQASAHKAPSTQASKCAGRHAA